MRHNLFSAGTRRLAAVLVGVWLFGAGALLAQGAPPAPPPPDQMLSPDQLNDLVAPIALYPDPLLSQVLVAATYPLEVVQAYPVAAKESRSDRTGSHPGRAAAELGRQRAGAGGFPGRAEAAE